MSALRHVATPLACAALIGLAWLVPASPLAAEEPPVAAPATPGVVFLPDWPRFTDVLAQAKLAGKPAFLDFTTDG